MLTCDRKKIIPFSQSKDNANLRVFNLPAYLKHRKVIYLVFVILHRHVIHAACFHQYFTRFVCFARDNNCHLMKEISTEILNVKRSQLSTESISCDLFFSVVFP